MPSRPRDATATADAILAAARVRFLHDGYAATTTRNVASDVGIDAALVHRYFGSKQKLWEAATTVELDLPDFAGVAASKLGPRVIHEFLERWEGEAGPALALLLSAAPTDPSAAERVRSVFNAQVEPAISATAPDRPGERTELVVTTLLGLATCRYILKLPGIADRPRDDVAALYGPVLQGHLTRGLDTEAPHHPQPLN